VSYISRHASRREFLRRTGALSVLAGAGAPFALNLATVGAAAAQSAGDYKALVCIFLFGGSDTYNVVLPTDTSSFANYTAIRNQGTDSIALLAPGTPPNAGAAAGSPARLGGVVPITPLNTQGRTFALHPHLAPLAPLFNTDRRLAILPNVGPLIRPLTKAGFNTTQKPAKLFSHNDQQSTWQAMAPEGARVGWGGRMADLLVDAANNGNASSPIFTCISSSGTHVFLGGNRVRQYQVGSGGANRLGGNGTTLFGSTVAMNALRSLAAASRSAHLMEHDHAAVVDRSIVAQGLLAASLPAPGTTPWGTPPAAGQNYSQNNDPLLRYTHVNGNLASNPLANQLQMVARTIAARAALGVGRQVFMVELGGFDTHENQNPAQADLMARLAHAMKYFDTTLQAMGLANNVTTFTATEFGRTFTTNGGGTDHGWGSHHFVMGGAVNGGDLYGTFPILGVKNANDNNFSSPDQLGNGALLPTTSVDQYAATLARWFGVSAGDLTGRAGSLFPNLANFTTQDLGFMKPA
jgi:uncharacterized protein (DUF1501 family)